MTITTERRIPLALAEKEAQEFVELTAMYAERGVIAGSIRRKSATVKDIEIVLEPRLEAIVVDLFGGTVTRNTFDDRCDELKGMGILTDRLDKNGHPAWGSKYKRAMFGDVPLDLFSVLPPAQWGVILAIRTGPWRFSQSLVTQRNKGGLLPNDMYVREGALWVKAWGEEPELIPTPTEESFFAAIEMPCLEPWKRGTA